MRWNDGDPPEPPALKARLDAVKHLRRAKTILAAKEARDPKTYVRDLASEIAAAHRPGTTTLVILNTVRRAQALHAALAKAASGAELLLIHSRFRPIERRQREAELREGAGHDRIVVASQAVEAGVDMTSATLFTELAPWSSLVQRFGCCNRAGERNELGGAEVRWIDLDGDIEAGAAGPYAPEKLRAARTTLASLDEVSPRNLPPPSPPPAPRQVIRPKDFEELFDTDADLSGYDLDISPYVRDSDDTSVQVFWRAVGDHESVPSSRPPARDELCSVPLGDELETWLQGKPAYVVDPLASRPNARNWVPLDKSGLRLRPGMVLLVDVSVGGYDPATGFVGKRGAAPVAPVAPPPGSGKDGSAGRDADVDASTEDDSQSLGYVKAVELEHHTKHVVAQVRQIAAAAHLTEEETKVLVRAAAWHDLGKSFVPFQALLGRAEGGPLLAKSARIPDEGEESRCAGCHSSRSLMLTARR